MSDNRYTNKNRRTRRRKTIKRKSPLLLLIVILLVVILALFIGNSIFNEDNTQPVGGDPQTEITPKPTESSKAEEDSGEEDESSEEVQPTSTPTPTPIPTPEPTPFVPPWNLLLVNVDNSLPEGYSFTQASYGSESVDERIYAELAAMMNDASNAGMSLWIASGYRSIELQEQILTNATNNRMRDYGMTQDEARANALQTIALPGSSEHHTGMAVDFNYVNYEFEGTKEFTWLSENAENYGFILRYPSDKVDITKINYEPWHYRYVGVEHAVAMNDLDMCLEEYLEYLN